MVADGRVSVMRTGELLAINCLIPVKKKQRSTKWKLLSGFQRFVRRRKRTRLWSGGAISQRVGVQTVAVGGGMVFDPLRVDGGYTFLLKYWTVRLIFGRLGWRRDSGEVGRLGLFGRVGTQVVKQIIFSEALNVLGINRFRRAGAGRTLFSVRNVWSFMWRSRQQKLARIFPLRRVHRRKNRKTK